MHLKWLNRRRCDRMTRSAPSRALSGQYPFMIVAELSPYSGHLRGDVGYLRQHH